MGDEEDINCGAVESSADDWKDLRATLRVRSEESVCSGYPLGDEFTTSTPCSNDTRI